MITRKTIIILMKLYYLYLIQSAFEIFKKEAYGS